MTERDTLDPQRSAKDGVAEDDWSLYAKFENGDLSAFHQLFDRYKNRIFSVSYRFVQNREAAEDIAQEVLIKIFEKKAKFRPRTKFSTWVYRVTANASLDQLRKRKFLGFSLNETRSGGEDDALPLSDLVGDGAPSISEALANKEIEATVTEAVRSLPEHLKTVMVFFGFEERSYQDIAEILGISTKTVERRIYHAKEILRNKLAQKLP